MRLNGREVVRGLEKRVTFGTINVQDLARGQHPRRLVNLPLFAGLGRCLLLCINGGQFRGEPGVQREKRGITKLNLK